MTEKQAFARCQQLQSFQGIADALDGSIKLSQGQYDSTIQHVDRVSTKRKLSQSYQENLDNITGRNSYAYVIPFTQTPPSYIKGPPDTLFSLTLRNGGTAILSGLTVTVSQVIREPGADDPTHFITALIQPSPIFMPNLSGKASAIVPNFLINPASASHYYIQVSAQNGATMEDLWFRKAATGNGWAYKLTVAKSVKDKRVPLLAVDWTEPASATDSRK